MRLKVMNIPMARPVYLAQLFPCKYLVSVLMKVIDLSLKSADLSTFAQGAQAICIIVLPFGLDKYTAEAQNFKAIDILWALRQ
jgi:hypothetical protein